MLHSSCFCCWIAKSCPTLCDPMDCSTPAFPVLHLLPDLAPTHVHRVSDAIQPSHPLSSPFLLPPNPPASKSFTSLYFILTMLCALQDLTSSRDWTRVSAVKAPSPKHWRPRNSRDGAILENSSNKREFQFLRVWSNTSFLSIWASVVGTGWPHTLGFWLVFP